MRSWKETGAGMEQLDQNTSAGCLHTDTPQLQPEEKCVFIQSPRDDHQLSHNKCSKPAQWSVTKGCNPFPFLLFSLWQSPILTKTFRICALVTQQSALRLRSSEYLTSLSAAWSCFKQTNRLALKLHHKSLFLQLQPKAKHSLEGFLICVPSYHLSSSYEGKRERTNMQQLSWTPQASLLPVSALVSSTAASHQYLQRLRAECSDSGSKVGLVYLLRCQLQPHVMLLLLRGHVCCRRQRHCRQLTDRSD